MATIQEEDDFFHRKKKQELLRKQKLNDELNFILPESIDACKKCNKKTVTTHLKQKQRSDEPPLVEHECESCGNKW